MARKKPRRAKGKLDRLVRGRSDVHQNQTGSGAHGDRRTKRQRDRSTRERNAVDDQDEQ